MSKEEANWGVVEIRDEYELLVEIHVVPMVTIALGVNEMSAAHVLNSDCECKPVKEIQSQFRRDEAGDLMAFGFPMWIHNDPEHPGSLQLEAAKQ